MSFTKKSGSLRQMKKIEDWYGVNKTTPHQWFERWSLFLESFMCEMGYQRTQYSEIHKVKRKEWTLVLNFSHPHLHTLCMTFSRKRVQEGGKITCVYGSTYNVIIDTLSQSKLGGHKVMSRQKVGDQLLNHIREGWSKSKNVDQED